MIAGLVLAAGAGSRYGQPKVLVPGWLDNAVAALDGLDTHVVMGAAVVPTTAHTIVADDWASGMSASLRAGLLAVRNADAVVIVPVDVPTLSAAMVARVAFQAGRMTLRQAAFGGRPGHPVVIGADHFVPLLATLHGDTGARPYLRAHGVELVECGDLGSGDDEDVRPNG